MNPLRGGAPEGGELRIKRRARSRNVGPLVEGTSAGGVAALPGACGWAATGGLAGVFCELTLGGGVEAPGLLAF